MTDRGRPRQFDLDDALDRAMDLFWRGGYSGASVNEIAAAMGVSKPSLYAAFGDKEALYLRALARYGAQQWAAHSQILDAEPDARTAVEVFLLAMVDLHADPAKPGGCMVVNGATTCDSAAVPASVQQALRHSLQSVTRALEARLARAQRDGQLPRTVDVRALATYFNTVLTGLSVQSKGQQRRHVLRGVVTSAMRAWPVAPARPAKRRR